MFGHASPVIVPRRASEVVLEAESGPRGSWFAERAPQRSGLALSQLGQEAGGLRAAGILLAAGLQDVLQQNDVMFCSQRIFRGL